MDTPFETPSEDEVARLAQCFGKESYPTPQLANKVARRRNRGGRRLSVYKCPHCHMWHMGSPFRMKKRFRRRRSGSWRFQ